MSQHPAELGLIQRADGADGTEELVQDVPAAANFIGQRWHINRRGFLDGIAVDALPDEPLMGASPASVLVIETGELLVRRTDDDLVARLKRYGTQGYAGAAGQGSLRGVKVFPCFSL